VHHLETLCFPARGGGSSSEMSAAGRFTLWASAAGASCLSVRHVFSTEMHAPTRSLWEAEGAARPASPCS